MSDAASHDVLVTDDPGRGRFELLVGGAPAGSADYHEQPGLVTILHTEIDPAFEGQGLGSAFVAAMLEQVRARDARVLPICPFVKAYLRRHPELAELVWKPG